MLENKQLIKLVYLAHDSESGEAQGRGSATSGGRGGSFVHPSMAERIMDGDRLSVLTPVSLPLLMELLMSSEGPGLMTSPNPSFFSSETQFSIP